ncbi:MAG: DUF5715 family protein [Terracidiphilus sp.]
MSAPSSMGRTAIITIALAAIAASAQGVPVTSAHARGNAPHSQTAHHAPAQSRSARASAHPHQKTAAQHQPEKIARHTTAQPAARKPTPEEVGRASGLKIRSQLAANHRAHGNTAASRRYRNTMDRRTVLRRSAPAHQQFEHRRPQLLRARYTPGIAAPPVEEAAVERPLRQPESETMSGTTRYESVDAETETTSAPLARRNAAPPPADSMAASADADSASSYPSDSDTSADRNAVHPSFARHAAAPVPETATDLDDRIPAAKEPAGENTNDYNLSEDMRLKAETEQASLTIARGYMPAPLRGNRASLERQNERLEAEGLERIEDESDLASRIAHHLLVPVPASEALIVNGNLPFNHRYCRPWTARFLTDLAAAHQAEFHRPLEVSSAVRTVEYQKRLMHVNGNAAPAEGDVVSPHLTGAAVDIPKDNLSRAEMAWMRRYLLAIEAEGKIDVEEEFQQSCFHIAVYKNYLPAYHPVPRRSQTPSQAHTGGSKRRTVPAPAPDEASADGL